ncbi:Arylsulfatase [Crateriforma conspicua]|uniref:Arylsulfatase n=1 Tax=Crateriforma conspicua TaxID=2527996 RepID=A0A5C6G055_9PLAN|nr:sulfatase-like hydrolase/transferase [Crateriforma conspicua]TWU66940.1 Arylsulfatase [Crateriforma conspicua]
MFFRNRWPSQTANRVFSFCDRLFSANLIARIGVASAIVFCTVAVDLRADDGRPDTPETPREASTRPTDIVVFLSDDHTVTDSSVYGSTEIRTPNMQRLADVGMTFDRAYVASPSCAPSRAALLTGISPARNGAERNHARPAADLKKLPAYFQELGYEVAAFGKVGHYRQTPEYGFDVAKFFNYHEDQCVDEAVKWLRARQSDQPLCLFVGTNWPHVPWPEGDAFSIDDVRVPPHHVNTKETREARQRYLQAVQTMDNELGAVYDATMDVLGKGTLFIHTSDHGAQWPFAKWNLYEEGIRTPLIVSWPGKIQGGVRTDAMVSWVDLLPTMVAAAGGDPDAAAPVKLDGRSIMPVLTGQADTHRDVILTTHSGDGNMNVYPARAVTGNRYKYIRNLYPQFQFGTHIDKRPSDTGYWPSWEAKAGDDTDAANVVRRYQQRAAEELYDLQEDPLELLNLARDPEYHSQLARLSTRLDQWMTDQGDQPESVGLAKLLPPSGQPPNVIMVFIDDMGWADLSCFGGIEGQTPNIDRLASEGIRLTNFYVNSPICSPSRTALTTGHYPARHRITSYLASRELNAERGVADWLDEEAVTLPRLLQQAGYACGHFGKWHMGGQRDVGDAPMISKYGFVRSLTNFEGLGPRVLPLKDAYDGKPPKPHALGSDKLGKGPIMWEDRSVITSRFVAETLDFVREVSQGDETPPFYVNVWPDDVHSPYFPPAGRRGDQQKRTLYLSVLKTMDEQLGMLFDRVRNDPKLAKNTLIFVASDNGHEPGAGSGGPLRGFKGKLYEGGIRSPLIVWGPGLIRPEAAGTVNETTIASAVDLVPSILQATGVSAPESYQPDGEDMLSALLGYNQAQRNTPLMWRRPPDHPGNRQQPYPDLAIRDKNWKLLCNIDGSAVELYDLANDIGETKNMADKRPQITKRLKDQLLQWNESLPADGVVSVPRAQQEKRFGKRRWK